jgi:hypothetical protein
MEQVTQTQNEPLVHKLPLQDCNMVTLGDERSGQAMFLGNITSQKTLDA